MSDTTVLPNGARVKELRQARGWSQAVLADQCEKCVKAAMTRGENWSPVSVRTVQNIEAGEAVFLGTLRTVAQALGVEVGDLLQAALAVHLDVRVWGPGDASRRGLSIRQPGTLPVRTGDTVRVEVVASRLVYLYVVWINSKGEAQP